MDNHVSNAINTADKCPMMDCLSAAAKRHDSFRFVPRRCENTQTARMV